MRIHEFHNGAGPTVVLLHGANAGGWMWNAVVERLPEFHLLVVDLPGHADAAADPWTTAEQVALSLAQAIDDRAADGRAHLVGFSLGGYVALHLLRQSPEQVLDLMVSGVPSRPLPFGRVSRFLGQLLTPFIHSDFILRASARAMGAADEEVAAVVAQGKRNSKQAFARINAQAVGFRAPPDALQTPVRKLFLAGDREHPAVRRSLPWFAGHAVNAVSYAVPDAGHGWCMTDPELFAQVVCNWVIGEDLPGALREVIPKATR